MCALLGSLAVGAAPSGDLDAGAGVVSLYRRFRPGRFEELRGQPHVVRALRSAVREAKVGHAYLFSGPRGTGKTSTARILARALNCEDPSDGEPCGRCTSCVEIARGASLDVHELDAASNNGVDAMRDLVSRAALGTPGRWKVYIVDEVHMLSNAAANALLKTLEEPPGHVVFVLATTDPQKVPPTIRSRTQHFEFRLLGTEVLEELLGDVRQRAGLDLDDEVLAAAVRRGHGSARDALSALDQAAAAGGVLDDRPGVARLSATLEDPDPAALLVAVAELHEAGWSSQELAAGLVDELRQAFLLALAPGLSDVTGKDAERLGALARSLGLAKVVRGMELLGRAGVDMREAPEPRAVLEVALVRLVRPELDETAEALVERVARLEEALRGRSGIPEAPPPAAAARAPANPAAPAGSPRPAEPASKAVAIDRDTLVEAWGDHVLRSLPPKAKALCSAGRFVAVVDGVAEFALPKAAHRDRCEEVRPVVEEALARFLSVPVPLRFVVEPEAQPLPTRAPVRGGRTQAPGPGPEVEVAPDVEVEEATEVSEVEIEAVARARLLDAFPGAEEVRE